MKETTRRVAVTAILAAAAGGAWAQAPQATPAEQRAERVVHVCSACHGQGGNGTVPAYPKLAGQPALYLSNQLRAFRAQQRADPSPQAYMWGISALLDEPTIEGLAEYYATQKPVPGKPGDPKLMAEGRRIFYQGIPRSGIMPCASCHGDQGEGAAAFPRIAGQNAPYIVEQLQLFGTRLRPHGVIMAERVVKHMTTDEMRAVAAYLQAQ